METIREIFTLELGENFFSHLIFHFAVVFFLYLIPPALAAVDLKLATSVARMHGERIRSHKLRKCLEKVTLYWALQFAATVLGGTGLLFPWYNLPYLTITATIAIGCIEILSYREHLKRRKDNIAKIPETVQEIIEFVGGVDELKGMLSGALRKKLGTEGGGRDA